MSIIMFFTRGIFIFVNGREEGQWERFAPPRHQKGPVKEKNK
jgi:hypothetical protein